MSNLVLESLHGFCNIKTEKRKKFPINRYDSYVSWSDG